MHPLNNIVVTVEQQSPWNAVTIITLAVAVFGLVVSGLTFWRSRPGQVRWEHSWAVAQGPTVLQLEVANVGAADAHDVQIQWMRPPRALATGGGSGDTWETIVRRDRWSFLERVYEGFRLEDRIRVRLIWREAPDLHKQRIRDISWRATPRGKEVLARTSAERLDDAMLSNGTGSKLDRKYRGPAGK